MVLWCDSTIGKKRAAFAALSASERVVIHYKEDLSHEDMLHQLTSLRPWALVSYCHTRSPAGAG